MTDDGERRERRDILAKIEALRERLYRVEKERAEFLQRTGMDKMANNNDKAVKMPEEYIQTKPRRFEELQVGETGYMLFTSVRLDEQRRTFINDLSPELLDRKGINRVGIRREADGFVLILPRDDKHTWRAEPLPKSGKHYPVIKIEQEP